MKQVVIISGSPRRHGKTAQTIKFLEEKLLAQGNKVDNISLMDYNIKHCIGCFGCMRNNEKVPACVQKDDVNALFERMIMADVIVYTSPIYSFDFCSLFKTFFDRQFSITQNYGTPNASSCLEGKDVLLLVACAGKAEENAMIAYEVFDRGMKIAMKANIVGKYVLENDEAPDFIMRAKAIASQMAESIAS